jgi:hypothetical protein
MEQNVTVRMIDCDISIYSSCGTKDKGSMTTNSYIMIYGGDKNNMFLIIKYLLIHVQ